MKIQKHTDDPIKYDQLNTKGNQEHTDKGSDTKQLAYMLFNLFPLPLPLNIKTRQSTHI